MPLTAKTLYESARARAEREPRFMLIFVSVDEMLTQFCRVFSGKTAAVESNLPPDVVCDHAGFDWNRNAFGFRLWHPSFAIVPGGGEIPQFDLKVRLISEAEPHIVEEPC